MKKIFLIDDNEDGNRLKYGADFVDEGTYHDVLMSIDKLSPQNSLDFVKDSACILLHKSFNDFYNGEYHDGSQKVKTMIMNHPLVGRIIPVVFFSDGDTNDLGDYREQAILSLSKRAFYGRLEDFVLHYQDTHEIELKILAYGPNYIAYLVDRYATILFSKIQDLQDNEKMPATKVHCEEMEQLVSLSQPSIGKTYKDIILDLVKNPMTVQEFKNRINNILESIQDYGKNINTWK